MSKFVSRLLLSSALAFAMAPVAQAQTPPPEAEGADTDEGGSDIVVIVDEAHRSQYEEYAQNMRRAMPNAMYMAFTGTPLFAKDKTKKWFGETISKYDFQESIEDGATVPLFYDKRIPQVQLQNDGIDEDFATIVELENLSGDQQLRLEREFAREMAVLKSDDRLNKIAGDIAFHFPRRGFRGKGMVICVDKYTAVRMYDKVKNFMDTERRNLNREISAATDPETKADLKKALEYLRNLDMAVVISEDGKEEEKFAAGGLDIAIHRKRINEVDENGHDLEYKFKDPADPLGLVFVCSMWLTGFDAPPVSTLYLDKPMRDHTLIQTIARANRVSDTTIDGISKMNGWVVDYYGVSRNLKKAFAVYGGGDEAETEGNDEQRIRPSDELYQLLHLACAECETFCRESVGDIDLRTIHGGTEVFKKVDLFSVYADRLLSRDEWKKEFVVYDNTIYALYEACKPGIIARSEEFRLAQIIHYLRQVIDNKIEPAEIDKARRRVQALLDESIIAEQEARLTAAEEARQNRYEIKRYRVIDLSKLNVTELRKEFEKAPYKNIEINDLRLFLEEKLRQMLEENPTRTSFSEKLRQIIDRINAGTNPVEDIYNELLDFMADLHAEDERHIREGLSTDELILFDLIKKENLSQAENQRVKLAAQHLLHRLREEKPLVLVTEWHKNAGSQQTVRTAIRAVLDADLPEVYDRTAFDEKCSEVFDYLVGLAERGVAA